MRFIDVVTYAHTRARAHTHTHTLLKHAYTHKIVEGFKISKTCQSPHCSLYSIKLLRSLYGLKQYECMWFNHLSEYLIKE